jgi:protein-S-isoprenylcysteine O-methyltransferase Ste14
MLDTHNVYQRSGTKSNVRWLLMLLADIVLIWGAFAIYSFNAWFSSFLQNKAMLLISAVAILFTIIRIISNISARNNGDAVASPGYLFLSVLARMGKLALSKTADIAKFRFASEEEKRTFRFILVKLYFIPVMLQFSLNNYNDLSFEIQRVIKHGVDRDFYMYFNNVIFPITVMSFFLIDTLLYSFGYLFESKALKNKIKSVDPTWSGWLVALICYPPCNDVLSRIAPQQTAIYAYFDSYMATFYMRIAVMLLLFVYAFASVSLGTRCSNLTNRGIVSRGAYSVVRHPAYISKVTVWWLTLLPYLNGNYIAITGMMGWTLVYFLRAITEERHLRSDPDYVAYCQKVKYRFIPYVY